MIEVRAASAGDYAAIGDLTVAAYLAEGAVTPDDPYLAVLRDAAARAAGAELWVAVEDGSALVGTVTWCPSGSPYRELGRPDEGEFRALAVAPAGRGRGAGALLVEHCVRRATEDGFHNLVISTATWMTNAHRLYRRLGFQRAPERDWQPRPDVQLLAFVRPLP